MAPAAASVLDFVVIERLLQLAQHGHGPEAIADKIIPAKFRATEPQDHCIIRDADGKPFADCTSEIAQARYGHRNDVHIIVKKPTRAAHDKWNRYQALKAEITEIYDGFAADNLIRYRDAAELADLNPIHKAVADAIGATRWRKIGDEVLPYAHGFGGRGLEFLTPDGGRVFLDMGVERGTIYLPQIAVEHKGSGIGAHTMEAIRSHAVANNLNITVYKVCNPDFFARFDWLTLNDNKDFKASYRDLRIHDNNINKPITEDFDMSGKTREARLHEAVRVNDLKAVESLLKQRANPNSVDDGGWTPLLRACHRGDPKLVRVLLDHRADPNFTDPGKQTALHLAAHDAALVDMLIGAGADLTKRDGAGRTPLICAIDRANEKAIARMFSSKANPDDVDASGDSALHHSLDRGHLGSIAAVLAAKPNLEVRDIDGTTPLLMAVRRGNIEAVDALLSAGANPNAPYDMRQPHPDGCLKTIHGGTALHHAALQRDPAMIRRLLEAPGIDVNAIDKSPDGRNRTPLMHAVDHACGKSMAMLINASANLDIQDVNGNTALHIALARRDDKLAAELLKAGADPDLESKHGSVPRNLAPDLVLRHSTCCPSKAVVARAAFDLVRDAPAAVRCLGEVREQERCLALATEVAQQNPRDVDSKTVMENIRKIRNPEQSERRRDMSRDQTPEAAPAFRR